MIDRKQLKAAARQRLSQSNPRFWVVMLFWVLASVVFPQLIQSLVSGPADTLSRLSQLLAGGIDLELALQALAIPFWQLLAACALSAVLSIYQMVLQFGLGVYSLRLFRGGPCGTGDLFSGFSMIGRVIGQQLLVVMIAYGVIALSIIPASIAVLLFTAVSEVLGLLVLIAAAMAVLVLVFVVLLNYALATLALADHPELGAMGAIQYGKMLISGHKWEFFVLDLSFFGWTLLCSLPNAVFTAVQSQSITLATAMPGWLLTLISIVLALPLYLWLSPYQNTVFAGYYDALQLQKRAPVPPIMPL